MNYLWRLIGQNCTGCGICRDVCSEHAIKMSRAMAYPEPIPGKCTGCLDCVTQCPFEAIEVTPLNNYSNQTENEPKIVSWR